MSISRQPRGILKPSQSDRSYVSQMAGDHTTQQSESRDPSSQSAATSQSAAPTNKVPKAATSLRVFSGGVAKVKNWTQSLDNLESASGTLAPVMFRVYGILISITPGASRSSKMISARTLVISDVRDSSQRLRCVFHEIDRNLDPLKIGACVSVTGKRITNRDDLEMQIFSVETFTKQEVEPYLARMENFADRALKRIN